MVTGPAESTRRPGSGAGRAKFPRAVARRISVDGCFRPHGGTHGSHRGGCCHASRCGFPVGIPATTSAANRGSVSMTRADSSPRQRGGDLKPGAARAPNRLFRDRRDAGRALAGLLDHYRGCPDVIVLGLPRGGVPVAYEIAQTFGAALDVFVVRKLGVPGREELAMGAIASGGGGGLKYDIL